MFCGQWLPLKYIQKSPTFVRSKNQLREYDLKNDYFMFSSSSTQHPHPFCQRHERNGELVLILFDSQNQYLRASKKERKENFSLEMILHIVMKKCYTKTCNDTSNNVIAK